MPQRQVLIAMQRFHQLVFVASLLGLSWLGMMAAHEVGHVAGAAITGGRVERVVLHPLSISRTDVSPNPSPLIVVWLGPIVGCVIPVLIASLVPVKSRPIRNGAFFFAGFCLIANGAYISLGSFDGIGDCRVMLQHGTPLWTLFAFGGVSVSTGLVFWHRLGSLSSFLANPSRIAPATAYGLMAILMTVLSIQAAISPI